MFKSKGGYIAYLGITGALIFLFLLLETTVFAAILPISPCYLSLPIAISLCLGKGKSQMFVGGTVFGVCSLILAFIFPKFAVFLNPLVSVVPRVMIGVVAYFCSVLFSKIIKNEKLAYSLSAIFGAVTNTVLVVLMMYLFKFTGIEDAVTLIISVNSVVEILASAVLVPTLVTVQNKFFNKRV